MKDLVEIIHDVVVRNVNSEIRGDLLRKRPVVVPAALILVVLDQVARDRACR